MICGELRDVLCFDAEILNENIISNYLVKCEKPSLVETGPASISASLAEMIEEYMGGLDYIFITHIHLDHGGGVGHLLKNFDAKVVCHPKAVKHLTNPEKLWKASEQALGEVARVYGKPEPVDEGAIIPAEDGQEFDLGSDVIKVIHTPGHSPHHISFYLRERKILFPGDSAGFHSEGRLLPTAPPPFMFDLAIESLDKQISLDYEYIAYSHYSFAKNEGQLERIREMKVRWMEIALDVVRNNGGIEELDRRLREDVDYSFFVKYDSIIARGFHQLTLLGFYEYARSKLDKG
ncbi:hypothetical protein Asulf_00568 [Archaeoglobus sulfaticallidus PM70-1]|uniref:Metallo-beta-lactamase domain-containing protein n=1 Tax=Archaeoglobus sulfaticallidus PM70-1 TaxID=387631 RepID=N0BAG3_9EURY|nr:MBL fold metallo-hydrolase [Archaeoglobus sulfaticallidus]AGK60589.1 hypothetical protein Asulf_00568 [Archaeoglobus sulfaticallidus PM70-1]